MTFIVSDVLSELLEPANLYAPDAIALSPRLVPAQSGIYGWWFDDALSEVPREGTLMHEGRHLLYVGIAPSGARGTSGLRTLRDRLKNHCCGPLAQSTLRRTLTALLGEELGLAVYRLPNGKLALSLADEAKLSLWMTKHLRVAWMLNPTPWELETTLIREGPRLPLNIRGSSDPFARALKLKRSANGATSDAPGS
jgi:hypothetical protein